jgi:Sulfotransferase family
MADRTTCIFIMSTKSSGSSVLQELVGARAGARHAAHTRHFENETLYWTKAASALGLAQIKLPSSEVPIPAARAARELRSFVTGNTGGHRLGDMTEAEIFKAFAAVCVDAGPIFLEKSPHHLYQGAAIQLMERFSDTASSVDVVFVGLIRNPLDTLYSSWRRFGVPPAMEEPLWRTAYENLQALAARRPDHVHLIRYEQLVAGDDEAVSLLERIGLPARDGATAPVLHSRSLSKWRQDLSYGHMLDPETIRLAQQFGYAADELEGIARPWGLKNRLRHAAFAAYRKTPETIRRRISTWRRQATPQRR